MSTLGDIVANVADQLSRSDLNTQIRREIVLAIKRYEREPFYVTETRNATLATAASTVWYSTISVAAAEGYPTWSGSISTKRIQSISHMRIESASPEPMRPLRYRDFERYQEGSASTGQPFYWTLYAGRIGIWPTPGEVYTMSLSAIVRPPVPELDADTSVWFDECQELIECAAVARVARKYIGDMEVALAAEQAEAVQLGVLRGDSAAKVATGRLRVNE